LALVALVQLTAQVQKAQTGLTLCFPLSRQTVAVVPVLAALLVLSIQALTVAQVVAVMLLVLARLAVMELSIKGTQVERQDLILEAVAVVQAQLVRLLLEIQGATAGQV